MKSIITKDFGVTNAKNFESMVELPLANVYVMLGKSYAWANTNGGEDDVTIETPYDTTQYKNNAFKDALILKRITGNDIQRVIPRVDWASGTTYVAYNQTANLFVKSVATQISGGNVNVSLSTANTVNANGINLAAATPSLSLGNIIRISDESKEIVSINAAGDFLRVNASFSSAYTNQSLYIVNSSTTQYYNKFYVRNSYDQVFKCLFNSNNATSTVMPQISIDGQLPENPYIETSDGYKWKYMYTIPSGLKEKFFTDKYMPVISDSIVYTNAENGRIDIFKITNGGSGYYNGGSITNYNILTVTGDGTSANITADVTSGVITDVNIINGGNDYSYATVTVNDAIQTAIGTDASIEAVISPQYGHGYDVERELGASDIMISVDFTGDVDGYLPTKSDSTDDFRQIAIVKDPKLESGAYGSNAVYQMFTTLYIDTPPLDFSHDAIVYVGSTYETANLTARVFHFDTDADILYINNIVGDPSILPTETIYQKDSPTSSAKVFSATNPSINILTGEILYIENRAKIIRSLSQTETVKLVVEF